MTISLYSASVPVFQHMLKNLAYLLEKAEANATARKIDPVVKASTLEWSAPARWGDTVTIDAETEKVGRTSATVRYTVRVGERVCCVVRNTYVCVDADGRPMPWPDDVRTRITEG